jgi:hypothetical protein
MKNNTAPSPTRMRITERGRQNASTLNFAEQLRDLGVALRSLGGSKRVGTSLIAFFTACVLTETELPDWLCSQTLSGSECAQFLELGAFVDENAEEIDRVVGSALEKIVAVLPGESERVQ